MARAKPFPYPPYGWGIWRLDACRSITERFMITYLPAIRLACCWICHFSKSEKSCCVGRLACDCTAAALRTRLQQSPESRSWRWTISSSGCSLSIWSRRIRTCLWYLDTSRLQRLQQSFHCGASHRPPRNAPSLAVALKFGMGSSVLKALVNELLSDHMVRGAKSSIVGLKYCS